MNVACDLLSRNPVRYRVSTQDHRAAQAARMGTCLSGRLVARLQESGASPWRLRLASHEPILPRRLESLESGARSWCSGRAAGLGVVDIRNEGRDPDTALVMLAGMLRSIEVSCVEGRMSGLPPLERQWAILRTMSARRHGATLRELADEHGVSQKTVRRDMETLRRAGFRLAEREEAHGRKRWIAEADPAAPPLSFDVSELLALWVSRSLLQPLAGTLFWESIHSALRKIRAPLSEPSLAYVDKLAGVLHQTSFRTSRYQEQAQLIDDLMVAIEDRRITFITYQSARSTEPLTYDAYPYGLVHHRGSLYLVAYSRQHDEVRTFKVDRLSDVALETLQFDKPADFDLQVYLQHSLGIFHDDGPPQRVVIRFAPEVARYIEEHHWHESQTLTPQKDGSLRAEFHLAALEELKSWVLSFGAKAIVEEPEELRNEMREVIETMQSHYGGMVAKSSSSVNPKFKKRKFR